MNGPHLRFSEALNDHSEWILADPDGGSFAVRSEEIDLRAAGDAITLGILERSGYRIYRLLSVEQTGRSWTLVLADGSGAPTKRFELVPRLSPPELGEDIAESRLKAANRLAEAIGEHFPRKRVRRVALAGEKARSARMIIRSASGKSEGLVADLTGGIPPERLLASAVLWLHRSRDSRRSRIERVFVLARSRSCSALLRLQSLMGRPMREAITILGFRGDPLSSDAAPEIFEKPLPTRDRLWKGRAPKVKVPEPLPVTAESEKIVSFAPGEIDNVPYARGLTFRYLGLPFARIRMISGKKGVWFGVGKARKILNRETGSDLALLIDSLAEYRRYDSPNKQHLYYQSSPEAWLESVIRRNVALLDRNLVISPVHHQFRLTRDRVDLLALRRDGTLAIIEIKVEYDTAMVYQAVEYWRKIEHQRRKGLLDECGLFGERKIADRPALIYLVGPAPCFSEDTSVIARSLDPSIGIYRYELAGDWRREAGVMRITDAREQK